MLAAAAAWDGLAGELVSAPASFGSETSGLAGVVSAFDAGPRNGSGFGSIDTVPLALSCVVLGIGNAGFNVAGLFLWASSAVRQCNAVDFVAAAGFSRPCAPSAGRRGA
ncbi:hypothetical protein MSIMFI_01561 [Mycobacterium simulans]|nr:hypothetical protein MSIMFI_01561 [Mycobacterium simulans]